MNDVLQVGPSAPVSAPAEGQRGATAMRPILTAAAVSGGACALFAAILWLYVAREPGVAIIAGAALTTARALTGLLILIGVRLSRRHSQGFPTGLYKLENLLALGVGLAIAIGAYELGWYALSAALSGADILPEPARSLAFIGPATGIALVLGLYKRRVARVHGSVALAADAGHSFVDFATGAVLCTGLGLDLAGVPRADSVAAVLAAVGIFWAGGTIVLQAVRVLLDASVERALLDEVRAIAAADPAVAQVLEVGGRNCGSFRFLRLRLAIAADTLAEADAAAARVRAAVQGRIRNVDSVIVELVEPGTGEVPAGRAEPASAVTATGNLRARIAATEWAEIVSALVCVVMAAAMIAVALVAGSVAVLAEGIDTVVDVVASIAVLVGIRLAARRTEEFPLGLYKIENLVAVGIGVLVLISAYELAAEAIGRILAGGSRLDAPLLSVLTMVAVALVTAALGLYKSRVGRAHGSPSLQADGRHALTDAVASAGVALGVGLQWAGIPHMDSIAALVVVALVAHGGLEVARDGLRVLLDASLEDEVLNQIRRAAEHQPGVRRVLAVEGRNSGSYRFAALRIEPEAEDLAEGQRTAERVAGAARAQVERLEQVSVELVAG